jgi:hypothetical protein
MHAWHGLTVVVGVNVVPGWPQVKEMAEKGLDYAKEMSKKRAAAKVAKAQAAAAARAARAAAATK